MLTIPGQLQKFNYTGSVQKLQLLPMGVYKLQVWGSQGSAILDGVPGKGGYSEGIFTNISNLYMYIYVGNTDGYNGRYESSNGIPGGGATHIALKDGMLKDLRYSIDNLLIVAGGGGAAERVTGGYGGGLVGGNGVGGYSYVISNGTGGTQTSGGKAGQTSNYGYGGNGGFGYGGHGGLYGDMYGGASGDSGPMGGGGYYGGGGVTYAGGAGGGSGYISPLLENAKTIGGNLSFPNINRNGNEIGHSGNGYAIVTLLQIKNFRKNSNFYKNIDGSVFDWLKLIGE